MAELLVSQGTTGLNAYALIRNATLQIWNGTTFVTFNGANYATYVVAMAEQGATGLYSCTFPAGISAAGVYYFSVHTYTSSPANGDAAVDRGFIDSGGSTENTVGGVPAKILSSTLTELTGVPSSTPALTDALMFLFMALRNKRTSDASTVKIYNAAGTLITTATQTDNGVTYSKEVFS
jgi:hypothetical protein